MEREGSREGEESRKGRGRGDSKGSVAVWGQVGCVAKASLIFHVFFFPH